MIVFIQPYQNQALNSQYTHAVENAVWYETPGTFSNTVYLGWAAQGTSQYQISYRTRHRLTFDGQDVPEYDDWTAWTDTFNNAPTPFVKMGAYNVFNTPLTLASTDFTGSNDQLCFEIRIRSCNSSGTSTGDWVTEYHNINYCPDFSLALVDGATLDFETQEILFQIVPGMARPVSEIRMSGFHVTAGQLPISAFQPKANFTYLANGNIQLRIPQDISDKMPRSGGDVMIRMTTADKVYTSEELTYTVTTDSPTPTHIKEPDVTAAIQDLGISLEVEHETASGAFVEYKTVSVSYSFTDSRGEYVSETIPLILDTDSGKWLGIIPAPPFGSVVSYTVTATGIYSGVVIFNTSSGTETIPESRWFVLSNEADVVWLGYELSFNRSIDNNVTVTQLASGRNIARHGAGSEGKITISGTILDSIRRGNISSIWLPDAQTLDDQHDWVLRTPDGDRYPVCVESWSLGASRLGIQQLSIDMQEVG